MKRIIFILFIFIPFTIFSEDDQTNDIYEEFYQAKIKYESEYPVFSQKGGMLRPGNHSFYMRTNDEWTGFSTFYLGYRYGVSKAFNIAVEGGVSAVPHVYLGAVLFHFRMYETPNKLFFLGARIRFGYRYQYSDFRPWGPAFANYLTLERNGLYLAGDLTAAFRLGKLKQFTLYYSIYPRVDFDFFDRDYPFFFLFSPVMAGFEVRYGWRMRWSFAVEAGYTFPIPWDSIPQGRWVNFPSLANVGVYYRFGNEPFYRKYSQDVLKSWRRLNRQKWKERLDRLKRNR